MEGTICNETNGAARLSSGYPVAAEWRGGLGGSSLPYCQV